MAHYKCLKCGCMTGNPSSHTGGHEPEWEHCTCGSGANPRRCDIHPGAYERHIQKLDEEAAMPSLSELQPREINIGLKLRSAIGNKGKVTGVEHDKYEGYYIYIEWENGKKSEDWLYNLSAIMVENA